LFCFLHTGGTYALSPVGRLSGGAKPEKSAFWSPNRNTFPI
jgi:hypothetical protein